MAGNYDSFQFWQPACCRMHHGVHGDSVAPKAACWCVPLHFSARLCIKNGSITLQAVLSVLVAYWDTVRDTSTQACSCVHALCSACFRYVQLSEVWCMS